MAATEKSRIKFEDGHRHLDIRVILEELGFYTTYSNAANILIVQAL